MTNTPSLYDTITATILAAPTRRDMVARLAVGDATVGELADPYDVSVQAVSKHIRVLTDAGLVSRSKDAQRRPCHLEAGVFDLVCGRPYYNLSREPRMQFRDLPFEHPFAALKADPARALYPQPAFNPSKAGLKFWLLLPWISWKLFRSMRQRNALSGTFAARLRDEVFPAFDRETGRRVVLKLAGAPGSEEMLALRKEFRLLASLDHPSIVKARDFGVTSDGRAWFSTDEVDGPDLATFAKSHALLENLSALADAAADAAVTDGNLAEGHGQGRQSGRHPRPARRRGSCRPRPAG